ncbi:MAG: sulfurtransferase complex subunit TusD [Venatoribacter sp.]
MANFTLVLTQSPTLSISHLQAIDFIEAAVLAGHTIKSVFFYQDAVYAALNTQMPIQGQVAVALQWQTLAQKYGFNLDVCIANALRRGVVDSTEQTRYSLPATTLAAGFNLKGLGELATACKECDRVIQF